MLVSQFKRRVEVQLNLGKCYKTFMPAIYKFWQ
jgi:hypothetical protein